MKTGALAAVAATLLALTAGASPLAAGAAETRAAAAPTDLVPTDLVRMFAQIYSSPKPVGFEQRDVGAIVRRHVPLGSDKAAVAALFAASPGSRIVEDSADTLLVRNDRSRAGLDPDARSTALRFSFDAAGKLTAVSAVHFKNQ